MTSFADSEKRLIAALGLAVGLFGLLFLLFQLALTFFERIVGFRWHAALSDGQFAHDIPLGPKHQPDLPVIYGERVLPRGDHTAPSGSGPAPIFKRTPSQIKPFQAEAASAFSMSSMSDLGASVGA